MDTSKVKTRINIYKRKVYPNPFIEFWGNLFNFSGRVYVYDPEQDSNLEDTKALAEDWRLIGEDMDSVMDTYRKKKRLKSLETSSN